MADGNAENFHCCVLATVALAFVVWKVLLLSRRNFEVIEEVNRARDGPGAGRLRMAGTYHYEPRSTSARSSTKQRLR
jgi:hypothetical protein